MFGKWKEQQKVNASFDGKIIALDRSLSSSFSNVKTDIDHLKRWMQYMHSQQDLTTKKIDSISSYLQNCLTKQEVRSLVDEYYSKLSQIDGSNRSFQQAILGQINHLANDQRDVFYRLQTLAQQNSVIQNQINSEIRTVYTTFDRKIDELRTIKDASQVNNIPLTFIEKLDGLNSTIQQLQSKVDSVDQKSTEHRQSIKEKILKKVARSSKEYIQNVLISLIRKYGRISGLSLREIVVEEQGLVSKSSFYRLLSEIEQEEGIQVVQEGKEKHYFWLVSPSNSPNNGSIDNSQ